MGTPGLAPRLVQLRWADRCSSCERHLPEATEAHWDPRARVVTCRHCSSGGTAEPAVPSIWAATQPTASDTDLRIDLSNRLDGSFPSSTVEFHWTLPVVDDQAIRSQLAEVELAGPATADVDEPVDGDERPPLHIAS